MEKPHSDQKRQRSPSPLEIEDSDSEAIPMTRPGLGEGPEGETVPLAPDVVGGLVAPQEITQSVTPDATIEDTIDRLAEKLAAFCFEHLEEDVNPGDGNDADEMDIVHEVLEEELRVSNSKMIR